MRTIRQILVPTDFSETATRALDYALELAKQLNASVHVAHVCPLLYYALADEAAVQDPAFEEKLKQHLREKLQTLEQELATRGHTVTTSLVDGNPGQKLPELADELGVDFIVIATHGRTGLSHMMLGSVAERVVRTAKVPVITVH